MVALSDKKVDRNAAEGRASAEALEKDVGGGIALMLLLSLMASALASKDRPVFLLLSYICKTHDATISVNVAVMSTILLLFSSSFRQMLSVYSHGIWFLS